MKWNTDIEAAKEINNHLVLIFTSLLMLLNLKNLQHIGRVSENFVWLQKHRAKNKLERKHINHFILFIKTILEDNSIGRCFPLFSISLLKLFILFLHVQGIMKDSKMI